MATQSINQLGAEGFRSLVESWNGNIDQARAYAAEHNYSAAELAQAYNQGRSANFISPNDAAIMLGANDAYTKLGTGYAAPTTHGDPASSIKDTSTNLTDTTTTTDETDSNSLMDYLDSFFNYESPSLSSYNLPSYDAIEAYVPSGDALVSNQMNNLLNENSTYMQTARATGERTAAARGLLSSSLAGEASQKAAIESALPIAQQDAASFVEAGLADYQGRLAQGLSEQEAIQTDYLNQRQLILQGLISSGLSAQEAYQNLQSLEYQALINSDLSEQEAQQTLEQIQLQGLINSGLSEQEAEQTLEQLDFQYLLEAGLSEQEAQQALDLQTFVENAATERVELELETQRNLANSELSAAEQEIISNTVMQIGQDYQEAVMNIQIQSSLGANEKTTQIAQAQEIYRERLNFISQLYDGVELTWSIDDFTSDDDLIDDTNEELGYDYDYTNDNNN